MTQILAGYTKGTTEVLDFTIDWSTLLGSDTISTSTWSVGTGITQDSESETTTTSVVWLSGGTVDTTYNCTNTIVTAGGRTHVRTIAVSVIER